MKISSWNIGFGPQQRTVSDRTNVDGPPLRPLPKVQLIGPLTVRLVLANYGLPAWASDGFCTERQSDLYEKNVYPMHKLDLVDATNL